MYYASLNPYSSTTNSPMVNFQHLSQEKQQKVLDILYARMTEKASAVDLYSRLVQLAPNKHNNEIAYILEKKKEHERQFASMYLFLSGKQPVYPVIEIAFRSFEEGVKKALDLELKSCQHEKRNSLPSHLIVQNVFQHVLMEDVEHTRRLQWLGFQMNKHQLKIKDYGPDPFVINIEEASKQNNTFRTALWTGKHLQVTLMSLKVGEDIGLEIHPHLDQFLRIEQGQGVVQMGKEKGQLDFRQNVKDNDAIMVPAGTWHNLTNTGNVPLKLYSIYAPVQHPHGTVHRTKEEAMAAEEAHD